MTTELHHTDDHAEFSLYAPESQIYTPWLKNYDPGVAYTVEPAKMAVHGWLDQSAEKIPDETALIFQNYKLSFKKLKELSEIMAANLREHGVQQGDRVAVMMPNLPQTFIAFWAISKAGAVAVFTNPLYMEHELLYQINDSEAKFMLAVDLVWPKIKNLRMRLGIKKYFVTSVADGLKFPLRQLYKLKEYKAKYGLEFDNHTVFPFLPLLKGKNRLSSPVKNPEETLAVLQYTGGTTGTPKGAMLTHNNFNANIAQICETLKAVLNRPHNFLGVMPFFHVYGLSTCLLLPVALGATSCILPRFNPIEVLRCIQKNKISIFPGAPSAYIAILQHKDIKKYDISSLKLAISGSAPMPLEYINLFAEKTGGNIIEGYGLTEASPITNINPLQGEHKPGSIGMPLPSTLCRIVDMELGNLPLPPGQPGELVIKGPQVMKGYWNRPDETANSIRNGWLYTGDIATMDEQGYVYIVDRKKDLVLVGGYNVYPREIDEVLYSHPKIKDAVSVGVPHKTRGEILKVYIVLKPGESMTKNEVITFCRSQLANYKVPKQVEFRDELPKSMVGKILRRSIRSEEEEKIKKGAEPEEILEAEDDRKTDKQL